MVQYLDDKRCNCGKIHSAAVADLVIGKGASSRICEFVRKYGAKKPFLLADSNTFAAGGERVCSALNKEGIPYEMYVFPQQSLEPDEQAVGAAVMHFDADCDMIIAIGSGVINDIGKILSNLTGHKYIIVATAPSMDGYASSTSSMSRGGVKVSLKSRCADVIIGDTEILMNAPERMLKAGLGDMLAKYVAIAEWRIAHIITGEYYCQQVAALIRNALKKCVDNAQGLLRREQQAVEAVFEGLVICGLAMAYAGVSRPASGVEHYFSHVWDMRGLEFGTPVELHGIQCAMGTAQAIKLYEAVKKTVPNKEKAMGYVSAFSYDAWKKTLRSFFGSSAETMIAQEAWEGKYNKAAHPARFAKIQENWDAILQILDEELPSYEEIANLLDSVGIPSDLMTIGVDSAAAKLTFHSTKDIRNKYVLSHLAWDLGIIDELAALL